MTSRHDLWGHKYWEFLHNLHTRDVTWAPPGPLCRWTWEKTRACDLLIWMMVLSPWGCINTELPRGPHRGHLPGTVLLIHTDISEFRDKYTHSPGQNISLTLQLQICSLSSTPCRPTQTTIAQFPGTRTTTNTHAQRVETASAWDLLMIFVAYVFSSYRSPCSTSKSIYPS